MQCVVIKIEYTENLTVITQQFTLELEKLFKDRLLK